MYGGSDGIWLGGTTSSPAPGSIANWVWVDATNFQNYMNWVSGITFDWLYIKSVSLSLKRTQWHRMTLFKECQGTETAASDSIHKEVWLVFGPITPTTGQCHMCARNRQVDRIASANNSLPLHSLSRSLVHSHKTNTFAFKKVTTPCRCSCCVIQVVQ